MERHRRTSARTRPGPRHLYGNTAAHTITSVIERFDPVPLRQTQPFKHNKKHSAEPWVVFLLREYLPSLGQDRY